MVHATTMAHPSTMALDHDRESQDVTKAPRRGRVRGCLGEASGRGEGVRK